ncbi:MAG: tRNA uridine-5-carboxymethylaminomethyl(34) synthesis GTPase MnmE [Oscillospiraceae bacterium]|nr:tRNA uridine-5-carboxymethylaminomethyl(34) synthesis GTPase MnmE [Oscillospiraceae bacterium]
MIQGTTIAAVSTPLAAGGIGIVRLSGDKAKEIASKVFAPVGERTVQNVPGFSAIYGKMYDSDGLIDDGIATVYNGPKSYTGEDVVELSCHGGIYIVQRVLRACLANGAAAAAPGEFTKRAFVNGKLDLTSAEAVVDIINSNNAQALKAALSAREGHTFAKIDSIKRQLISLSANLAAWADYPEEDLPELDDGSLLEGLQDAERTLTKLLNDYDKGSLYRSGVSTVIVGKPNVGKSTLMNLLSGREKSIVTPIAGTTRDVVEDTVSLGNIVLNLADTAGLRETADVVEQAGVQLARRRMEDSYLVIAVFDSSSPLDDEDMELINSIKGRPCVAVINKSDLERKLDTAYLKEQLQFVAEVSAANKEGVEELSHLVEQALGLNDLDLSADVVVNERQRNQAALAKTAVEEAISALNGMMTLDAVNVCIDDAVAHLCELTGENASAAVVEQVFSRFCVGK